MVWTEETFQRVRDGIDAARECRSLQLSEEWGKRVKDRATSIKVSDKKRAMNIFIFHVKVPAHLSKIETHDIKGGDQSTIDYESLLQLNIKIALWSEPRARVIVVTDHSFMPSLKSNDSLEVIRLKMNTGEPMFERVLSMAAYVESFAFNAPTVFLDIDAFLIHPVNAIFKNNFDVGLTHRHIVGQMPINEGVIFANNLHHEPVVRFFRSYLASYLTAEKSKKVQEIYQNIRRWRGGQLAINSAAGGHQFYNTSLIKNDDGVNIAYLPCSKYNLSQIDEREVTKALRDRCCVLHLKGNRKSWVNKMTSSLSAFGFY